jgi:hypothetical protein
LMKYALVVAALSVLATPAFADEVGLGVGVGPGGPGVTVGQSRDYDRDRVRERDTVIKEREPADARPSSRRNTMTVRAARLSSRNANRINERPR